MRRKKLPSLKPPEQELTINRQYVKPKTFNQKEALRAINEHKIIFLLGVSGTGKTHCAVGAGIEKVFRKEYDRLVISRPAVEAGESMGFLPGNIDEKIFQYLLPIFDELSYFINKNELKQMLANYKTGHRGGIEIAPIAYLRGRSLKNCFIVLDEVQNLTKEQLKMVLTRLGTNSKMVLTGDLKQSDINNSGLEYVVKSLSSLSEIAIIHMKPEDICRDPLIGKILERI